MAILFKIARLALNSYYNLKIHRIAKHKSKRGRLIMKERITTYLKWMDEQLNSPDPDTDYQQLMKRHLREIAFFQHERFIHLIVMALVMIATILVFLHTLTEPAISLLLLMFVLLILDIPYVKHYFLLENGVQKMYYQYDALYAILYPNEPAPVFDKRPSYCNSNFAHTN